MPRSWCGCFLVLCIFLELGRCRSGCNGKSLFEGGEPVRFSRSARILLQDIAEGGDAEQDEAPAVVRAAKTADIAGLEVLIRTTDNIDAVDDQNRTALWFGASRNDLDMVEILLEAGADPNIKSLDGTTPLYIASGNGNVDLVDMLVKNGADIEPATEKGATPLLIASQAGHPDVVFYLIEAGADLTAVKKASGQSSLWSAAFFGHDQVVRFLLEAGAEADQPEESGATPLYAASQEGHLASVLSLYEAGAKVNSTTLERNATPLHVAAAECHTDIVATLLLFGGNPRSIDSSNTVPENVVCIDDKKDEEKIKTLLSYAASLDKVIGLQEVLDRGVTFEPSILEWIKRLLNPLDLDTKKTREVTGYSGENSRTGNASEQGLNGAKKSDSTLVALVLIATMVGFVLACIVLLVLWTKTQKYRIKTKQTAARPVVNRAEHASQRAQRTMRPAPTWKEPQMPRPTVPRRGSLDSNPLTLQNLTNDTFSRDALLEWLREPQSFAPSNRWDLEPQIPGVAASEGSKSSAQGTTVGNWNLERSRSFSSGGGHSSRGRVLSDRELEAHPSGSQAHVRPLTLFHIDPATRGPNPLQQARSGNSQRSVSAVQHGRSQPLADEAGPSTSKRIG